MKTPTDHPLFSSLLKDNGKGVSLDDVNIRVENKEDGTAAYVVPLSVQSMITQTDKNGKAVKLTNTVSVSLYLLILGGAPAFAHLIIPTSQLSY
jgi:ribulose 1,5-bisphosphate synthetase/thiazole synthase